MHKEFYSQNLNTRGPFERPGRRPAWDGNIKMEVKGVACEFLDCVCVCVFFSMM